MGWGSSSSGGVEMGSTASTMRRSSRAKTRGPGSAWKSLRGCRYSRNRRSTSGRLSSEMATMDLAMVYNRSCGNAPDRQNDSMRGMRRSIVPTSQ